MPLPERFAEIVKPNEPLASYTHLKLGGPAEMLVQPRSREELADVLRHCNTKNIPIRVLGGGGNVLVRDEGVVGVVLRLSEPAFTQIAVDGRRVSCGAGLPLSALISEAARNGLGGLETLVGIPGTVGGALRCNAGDRGGESAPRLASRGDGQQRPSGARRRAAASKRAGAIWTTRCSRLPNSSWKTTTGGDREAFTQGVDPARAAAAQLSGRVPGLKNAG